MSEVLITDFPGLATKAEPTERAVAVAQNVNFEKLRTVARRKGYRRHLQEQLSGPVTFLYDFTPECLRDDNLLLIFEGGEYTPPVPWWGEDPPGEHHCIVVTFFNYIALDPNYMLFEYNAEEDEELPAAKQGLMYNSGRYLRYVELVPMTVDYAPAWLDAAPTGASWERGNIQKFECRPNVPLEEGVYEDHIEVICDSAINCPQVMNAEYRVLEPSNDGGEPGQCYIYDAFNRADAAALGPDWIPFFPNPAFYFLTVDSWGATALGIRSGKAEAVNIDNAAYRGSERFGAACAALFDWGNRIEIRCAFSAGNAVLPWTGAMGNRAPFAGILLKYGAGPGSDFGMFLEQQYTVGPPVSVRWHASVYYDGAVRWDAYGDWTTDFLSGLPYMNFHMELEPTVLMRLRVSGPIDVDVNLPPLAAGHGAPIGPVVWARHHLTEGPHAWIHFLKVKEL